MSLLRKTFLLVTLLQACAAPRALGVTGASDLSTLGDSINLGSSSGDSNSSGSGSDSSGSNSSSNESSGSSGSAESSGQSRAVLTTASVGVAVLGLGYVLWQGNSTTMAGQQSSQSSQGLSRPSSRPAKTPRRRSGRAARLFLRAHEYQLAQDLALGAGPSIEELATAAEIQTENVARFGRLLRENRAELLALAQPSQLTSDRALEFFGRLGELAWADPQLERDGRAFLERHGP
jgi:hypothetical protein